MEDFRQRIADSWPRALDDTVARQEWGWQPDYGVEEMTRDMLRRWKTKMEKKGVKCIDIPGLGEETTGNSTQKKN